MLGVWACWSSPIITIGISLSRRKDLMSDPRKDPKIKKVTSKADRFRHDNSTNLKGWDKKLIIQAATAAEINKIYSLPKTYSWNAEIS